jgi:hypothetical protein
MSYNRPIKAGVGLKQIPTTRPGIQEQTLESEIATTSTLGIIKVGSGLSITPQGVLSAENAGLVQVKIANANYSILASDYYIGANTNGITITLPLGITGKIYMVKNQVNGNITLTATGGQQIDNSNSKSLGSNDCIVVLFNGTSWAIISRE